MQDSFFGGLDFGARGVRISIINLKKEIEFSNYDPYDKDFYNPNSWIHSCEKLLHTLPVNIKSNIVNLAISGNPERLAAFDLKGDPKGEAEPYTQTYEDKKVIIERSSNGIDNLQSAYNNLTTALTLIKKYGENILLRNQSDWITGWFLKDWRYGEEVNNIKLGWDQIKESWSTNYLHKSWQKCFPLIVKSGEIIGQIDPGIAERFKLNKNLSLISGTTNSNAAFLAAELKKEEGLTLLEGSIGLKKIHTAPISEEGIINHRVGGNWICGGESNAGYGILTKFFSNLEIKELSRQINTSKKTSLNLLPLNSRGEKFPVNNPFLEPILNPRPISDSLYLHALFEGLARIESKGWSKLYELTGSLPKRIITIGIGSKNPQLRSIREKIINIPIVSGKKTASFGTALLAKNAKK